MIPVLRGEQTVGGGLEVSDFDLNQGSAHGDVSGKEGDNLIIRATSPQGEICCTLYLASSIKVP